MKHFPIELSLALIATGILGHVLRVSMRAYTLGPISEQRLENTESVLSKYCFVISPFGKPYDQIYDKVIKPLFNELKMSVKRADEMACSHVIMEDVRLGIASARVLIADLSGKNSNVYYELGFAHALEKHVLLITQDIRELPFDIRHYRCYQYKAEEGESWLELTRWLRASIIELESKSNNENTVL